MASHNYRPLKYKVMLFILLLVVLPILASISLIDFFNARNDMMDSFNRINKQTESNIKSSISIADAGFKMFERSLDDKMEKAFIPFLEEYEESGRNPSEMNLEKLKEQFGMDLYIINEDNIIVQTTKESDMGLDFNQWPSFADYLKSMRNGEGYYADRMIPSVKEKTLTKWAYHPTPDNKYLLELGLASSEFNEFFVELDPIKIADELEGFNPAIIDIRMIDENFDVDGLETEGDSDEPSISKEVQNIVEDLWENEDRVIERKEKDKLIRYFFVNRYDEKYASNTSRVIEITYSTQEINERLTQKALYHVIIGIVGIVLSIIITFIVSAMISNPIHRIVEDVDTIANGNLDHKIDVNEKNELKILENSINYMVDNTKNHIQQIEENEAKIKEYNDHLEDMVEKRTEELNKANQELTAANKIMMQELEMARRVQQSIIPQVKNLPHHDKLNYASDYSSMESIGGDIYDVIRVGRNSCGLLMADVSGHGVPAALITTMAKVSFNSNSDWGTPTGEICNKINEELFEFIGDLEYYLTAYYCIIDLETGLLKYTNCGHHPAILYRPSTKQIMSLDTGGTFIGAFPEVNYETKEIQLEEGDRLLMYTDGIVETRNEKDEFFETRLLNFIADNSGLTPTKFVDKLVKDVDDFCNGEPPQDDRAVLYIEFVKKVEPNSKAPIQDALNIGAVKDSAENIEEKTIDNEKFKQMYDKSVSLIKKKDYQKALEILLELKENAPDNVKVLNNLSIAYYKLGKLHEAHDILKNASEKFGENESIKKNLEIVNRKLKNS